MTSAELLGVSLHFTPGFSVGILAAVVLSTLPLFVLYLFGRRQLIAGLTAGFGK